jgi:hypothetical protein
MIDDVLRLAKVQANRLARSAQESSLVAMTSTFAGSSSCRSSISRASMDRASFERLCRANHLRGERFLRT